MICEEKELSFINLQDASFKLDQSNSLFQSDSKLNIEIQDFDFDAYEKILK